MKIGVQRDYLDSKKYVDLVIFVFNGKKYYFIAENKIDINLFMNTINFIIKDETDKKFIKFWNPHLDEVFGRDIKCMLLIKVKNPKEQLLL